MENRTYADLTETERGQLHLTEAMALQLEQSPSLNVEEFRPPVTDDETELARCMTPGDTLSFPLVTGFTVYGGPAIPGRFYELTIRDSAHDVPAVPVRLYLLTVRSHGRGILGLFPSEEAAKSAAQVDLNLRFAAEAADDPSAVPYPPLTCGGCQQTKRAK